MRLFLELAFAEIAEVRGISVDSAENGWKFARAWLRREWKGRDRINLFAKFLSLSRMVRHFLA
jgi:hypothetical protein